MSHIDKIKTAMYKVRKYYDFYLVEYIQYKPKERRNIGRPRKRWSDQIHFEDQGRGNTSNSS
jgi:hypothetical protein